MKSNAIQIPKTLRVELDKMVASKGQRSWTAEIDAIIIEYHGKLSLKKTAAFISKRFFYVTATTVFNRYHTLTDAE